MCLEGRQLNRTTPTTTDNQFWLVVWDEFVASSWWNAYSFQHELKSTAPKGDWIEVVCTYIRTYDTEITSIASLLILTSRWRWVNFIRFQVPSTASSSLLLLSMIFVQYRSLQHNAPHGIITFVELLIGTPRTLFKVPAELDVWPLPLLRCGRSTVYATLQLFINLFPFIQSKLSKRGSAVRFIFWTCFKWKFNLLALTGAGGLAQVQSCTYNDVGHKS